MYNVTEKLFYFIVVLLIGSLLFLMGLAIKEQYDPTYNLNKKYWTCTQVQQETSVIITIVGKTVIQTPQTSNVCITYQHI